MPDLNQSLAALEPINDSDSMRILIHYEEFGGTMPPMTVTVSRVKWKELSADDRQTIINSLMRTNWGAVFRHRVIVE